MYSKNYNIDKSYSEGWAKESRKKRCTYPKSVVSCRKSVWKLLMWFGNWKVTSDIKQQTIKINKNRITPGKKTTLLWVND